ncbi:hypothetical protein HAX54_012006, partial [Datura stramonium]|nr:hypothetical protein [Datura stramonium]
MEEKRRPVGFVARNYGGMVVYWSTGCLVVFSGGCAVVRETAAEVSRQNSEAARVF